MEGEALSKLDIFLRVWAVLGPLLVGMIGAIWSRRVQKQDREFEAERQNQREAISHDRKKEEWTRDHKSQTYREIKEAYARFMADMHKYVRKQSDYLTNVNPETAQAASAAFEAITASYQHVVLLSNDAVEASAIELWNILILVPRSYNKPMDDEYKKRLEEYKAARGDFSAKAKAHLLTWS